MEINGSSGTLQTLLVIVAGVGLLGYGGYSVMTQSTALTSSITVDGTVESLDVQSVSQRRGVEYRPEVSFTYSYNEENYTSDNLYPGGITPSFNSEESAMNEIKGFETGSQVTVYLNPEMPGQGFITHESSNRPYFVMLFGLIFTLFGAYSAVKP